ncbi:MAG: SDR family NAD(P)-dependent oxidoreductase [Deltaproteobacteria bacterium]|jgi:FlaA1/EpsC-like NDP-sugar epimerase|nr:SDR family NAD(P)-dependent oxidoreductase [Deltaproteobacteria bacterium]MBW2537436.1 SDR family NAD(P)-dependent oxidoreductase [Deltaproteobacteria bacterium]
MDTWTNKTVMITGVCGTIGRALLKRLLETDVKAIIGLDANESSLFFLEQANLRDDRLRFTLGDVRDRDTLVERSRGVDILLHTAAYKHVRFCEDSPREAIMTNIHGVQNAIEAANANGIQRILFTSSDKAVNPTNVMGTSKLMGERLVTAANAALVEEGRAFASCRFGNVIGSSGSVLPLFRRQIEAGGPITLTDPGMTRFIMTVDDAAQLVMDSALLAHGGEAFVTKMRVIRIADLAHVMTQILAPRCGRDPESIQIEEIGPRPGEKMYEELLTTEEMRRTVELDRYYVVLPPFKHRHRAVSYDYDGVRSLESNSPYNSAREEPMGQEALQEFLVTRRLLDDEES